MLKIIRKSDFGNELAYVWEGKIPLLEVRMQPAKEQVKPYNEPPEGFEKWLSTHHPSAINGQLFGMRDIQEVNGQLIIYSVPTDFATYMYFQKTGNDIGEHPAAWGINVLQHTTDGYFLTGFRTNVIDHPQTIGSLGAGFFRRGTDDNLADLVRRQCNLETAYKAPNGYELGKANVLAAAWNKDHNIAVVVHLPLLVTASQVFLNNSQHTKLISIRDEKNVLDQIVRTGKYEGKSCTEQLIGCFEQYLRVTS